MIKSKLYNLIQGAVLSEKSSNMANESNKYTFTVSPLGTKRSVAKALEVIFDVKVARVNIINMKSQRCYHKGKKGKTSSYKKAIATLVDGHKIGLFGSA